MISVKKLSKRFDDLVVLDNIDTEIDKGEVICVIGPSGGKVHVSAVPEHAGNPYLGPDYL